MKITSRDNSLLRRARAVRDGKIQESIFVEGLRLCEEALSSNLKIEAVIYSEDIARKLRAADLIAKLSKVCDKVASVTEKLLDSISYTKTPQGIVLLATRPASDEVSFKLRQPRSPLLVIMHGVNNPVNVGAILRTAEAAGVIGAITTANTADPFSAKALRGAMGSAFRLPIWTRMDYADAIAWCAKRGIRTIGASAHSAKLFTDIDWQRASALIVGSESNGLSPDELAPVDETVSIPMQGEVESLNVAVATAVMLYEAARQKTKK